LTDDARSNDARERAGEKKGKNEFCMRRFGGGKGEPQEKNPSTSERGRQRGKGWCPDLKITGRGRNVHWECHFWVQEPGHLLPGHGRWGGSNAWKKRVGGKRKKKKKMRQYGEDVRFRVKDSKQSMKEKNRERGKGEGGG